MDPPYSNKQLRRAGRLLRDAIYRERLVDVTRKEVFDAVGIIDWYRAEHSRPLVRVNAGLRYYVGKTGAEINVTQRLS